MLIVDIGEISSAIGVVQDGVLRFVRYTEEASGRKLTKAVSLEVKPDTDDEAERIKLRYGNVALDYAQPQEYYSPDDWERDTTTMGRAEEHEEMVIAMDAASRPVDDEPTLVMPAARGGGRAADDLFGDLGDPAGADEVFIPASRPGSATEPMPTVEDAGRPATATQPVPPIETPDTVEDIPLGPTFPDHAEPGVGDFIIEEPGGQAEAAAFAPAFDPTRSGAPDDEAYARQLVGQAVVEPLAQLAAEIRRSIEYYRGRHQDVVPERILLLGGTALLPNLPEFLQRELSDLGIPVECGDPLLNVAVDERVTPQDYIQSVRPVVATAVGMCLREII
jgi:hypothetical protein